MSDSVTGRNIERFEKLLSTELDVADRATIMKLLKRNRPTSMEVANSRLGATPSPSAPVNNSSIKCQVVQRLGTRDVDEIGCRLGCVGAHRRNTDKSACRRRVSNPDLDRSEVRREV